MIKDIYFDLKYAELYKNSDEVIEEYSNKFKFGKVYYIFLKRKINTKIVEKYYDIITPYGYGGPFFYDYEKENLNDLVIEFRKNFSAYCNEQKIVSEFIRFHPLLENYKYLNYDMEILSLSNTVYINLLNEEQILNDMDGKARNMLRKAIKNNVKILESTDEKNIENFIEIYYKTMQKNEATNDYYFTKDYFKKLFDLGTNKVKLFNAYLENEIISSTIILIGEDWIHYHLSGNTEIGYKLAANNLLLFEIAKWGVEKKYKKFHLGGGFGGDDSPLFKFKNSMAKNNLSKFFIAKKIYEKKIYEELNKELEFEKPYLVGKNLNFFPIYRRK